MSTFMQQFGSGVLYLQARPYRFIWTTAVITLAVSVAIGSSTDTWPILSYIEGPYAEQNFRFYILLGLVLIAARPAFQPIKDKAPPE